MILRGSYKPDVFLRAVSRYLCPTSDPPAGPSHPENVYYFGAGYRCGRWSVSNPPNMPMAISIILISSDVLSGLINDNAISLPRPSKVGLPRRGTKS